MLGQILEPIQISDMLAAKQRLRKEFPPSPLLSIAPLDQELGTPVYLKAENLLPSAAYKFRGATNKIKTLIETSGTEVRIITASSGNHGMACALAASRLGIPATVVVPVPTPQIKKTIFGHWVPTCWKSEKPMMTLFLQPVSSRKRKDVLCASCL